MRRVSRSMRAATGRATTSSVMGMASHRASPPNRAGRIWMRNPLISAPRATDTAMAGRGRSRD